MTEEDATNQPAAEEPEKKKKTSVKVVKRVKSKKSEKGERPELKPPSGDDIAEKPEIEVPAQTPVSVPTPPETPRAPPVEEAPPVVRRPSSKKRPERRGSNVFSMFTPNQVQQFKEAFSFIDQDKDGIISKNDIRASFDALGRLCSDKELDEMAREAPGPINFTMFLNVFGDRIQGTDDEDVVVNAFNLYDEGDGFCKEDK